MNNIINYKLPPLPTEPLKLKRQNAYHKLKPDRYYRYHELINTIKEFKKENKRLRQELERYSKKYNF